MPPRPFPYPLRVGTDICNVSRIRSIITRRSDGMPLRPLSQLIRRILTYPERTYFWARFGPPEEVLTNLNTISQFLAGRFAAKEACRKACDHLHNNARGFHQIIILPLSSPNRNQSSPPRGLILDTVYDDVDEECEELTKSDDKGFVRKTATRHQIQSSKFEGQLCEISISHDRDFATAVAIVPSMVDRLPLAERPLHDTSARCDKLLAKTSTDEISVETEEDDANHRQEAGGTSTSE